MAMVLLGMIPAYLIGSINVSILISRHIFHHDIRSEGSGNAGATNAARVYGMSFGLITFLGDFIKTLLALWLGRLLGGEMGVLLAGAAALVGHCYPVYYRFKGGKGVSSGAAVAAFLDWRILAALVVIFAAVALTTKIVSAASLSAAVALAALTPLLTTGTYAWVLALFAAVMVFFMHRENIRRLLHGTEGKFHAGKRKREDGQ